MRYSEEVIEEVRMRNDIVDVISGYVRLQKKGSSHFGLCPFHNEKSPSFSVSGAKQMYYCFGCGAGGNVITFIMEYENYSFTEALGLLAEKAGMALPKAEYSREDKEKEDLKKTLLELNKLAANYFYYQLKQPQGALALDYLKKRELTDQTIKHFGLGFANKTSNDLYQYLKAKGFDDQLLKESGLVTVEERGGRDKFWNRVIFPILDVNNRVIGFGGRVMGEGTPKYLNSPETRLFDKSRNLFGLNFARTSRADALLICEGYMDVISLHQAGFTNAVASLGTAFTGQQANLLKRYTRQVILTYDSDGAGQKAALRAIPILKEAGLRVRVLDMSPYKDPDEFIKQLGAEAFNQRIKDARNSFLYEIDVLKKQFDLKDPEQKTGFYRETARRLLEFTENLERDNYIQAVAKEHFIPYEDLRKLVNKTGAALGPVKTVRKEPEPRSGDSPRSGDGGRKREKISGVKQSQRLLLTWLIENEALFDKIKGVITAKDFIEPLYHEVALKVFDAHEKGRVNPAGILNYFIENEEQYREVAALFNTSLRNALTDEEQKKAFAETVMKVKKNSLDDASRRAADINELQQIIKAQAALKNLHIPLD